MKSSSRDSPATRSSENARNSPATASAGKGRLKNSDLENRRTGSTDPTIISRSHVGSPRCAQKRRVFGKDRCCCEAEVGSVPTREKNSSNIAPASEACPNTAPYTSTEGGSSRSAVAVTFRLAASSSGTSGAHDCQAPITSAAREKGHETWTFVASGAGMVRKTRDVTTPNVPAPAPRSAQNRSSWCCSSH